MSEIVNQSLQKTFLQAKTFTKNAYAIAKGAGIVFIGTIIGLLLGFVSRVIIVGYTTQSEYGIYCLALTVISIVVTISMLGLGTGSPRYIAYFRGKREDRKGKRNIG